MTDEERCTQIIESIDAAIVAYTLDLGEAWAKKRYIVRIPEDDFKILRRYHKWERCPVPGPNELRMTKRQMEQEVDLPRYRVRNGGRHPGIQISLVQAFDEQVVSSILEQVYLPSLRQVLNHSSPLLKHLKKDDPE